MKSDEELCERKANIDGMDQGWNLIKVKYVGITLWVAAAVSIQWWMITSVPASKNYKSQRVRYLGISRRCKVSLAS